MTYIAICGYTYRLDLYITDIQHAQDVKNNIPISNCTSGIFIPVLPLSHVNRRSAARRNTILMLDDIITWSN